MGLTILNQDFFGNGRVVVGEHTMPASYSTGGDPADPTSFSPIAKPLPRMTTIRAVVISGAVDGRLYQYDYANKKIKAFDFDYPNAAAGVAREVPAATNLSGTTLRVLFIGE